MSVITKKKEFQEILELLRLTPSRSTVVLGCDKCAKTSETGGTVQVAEMRELLSGAKVRVKRLPELVDALEEGLCDPKAVREKIAPRFDPANKDLQVLALSCGAGLLCLRNSLPQVRIIPGLDTLGPGVKGELACLSCGHCRFDEQGCRMKYVSEQRFRRLDSAYPVQIGPTKSEGAQDGR
ncbi:MAG: hypothetical protein HRF49_04565 [bacterium]|jgi:hypothetical protein